MPIEIRELTIKATVVDSATTNAPSTPDTNRSSTQADKKSEKMIEQVIKILKQRKER